MAKRWRKGRKDDESDASERRSRRAAPSEPTESPEEDLASRLGSPTSTFTRPPTAEELRAAFSRKKTDDAPPPPRNDSFSSKYSAESLFDTTPEPPKEEGFVMAGEDRSRTSGDYYYDPADAWGALGLSPGASWKEISSAHRRLAKEHHPDRMADASPEERAASEEAMRDINVAYSVLRRLTGH